MPPARPRGSKNSATSSRSERPETGSRGSAPLVARLAALLEGADALGGVGAAAHRGKLGAEPRGQLRRPLRQYVLVDEALHRRERQRREVADLQGQRDRLVDLRSVANNP